MAAGNWTLYNLAKLKIGNGTMPLSSAVYRISLYKDTSNAATLTLGTIGSVSNEVAEANGYSSSGKSLDNTVWKVDPTSATKYKYDVTTSGGGTGDPHWSAGAGGSIVNIKFAVIWLSAGAAGDRHLLAYVQLTSASAGFDLAANNTLTLQMAPAGIITLQ